MSSILKALKKLEEQHPDSPDVVSWPRKLGPSRIIRRWEIHSVRLTRILWGSLGLIVLAAAAWVVFYMQRPIAAEPDGVAAVTIPEPVDIRKSPIQELSGRSRPTIARDALPPKDVRGGGPGSRMNGTPSQSAADTGEKRKPAAAQSTGRSQPKTPTPSGLTLQAISWSEQQADRIAVINNEIVREGVTFEGYSVVRIESDRVLLRKDGEAWALAFNLQKSSD